MERIIKYLEPVELWRVNVVVNGKHKQLGYFETEEQANNAADCFEFECENIEIEIESDPDEYDPNSEKIYVYDVPYTLNHVGTENQRAYSYKSLKSFYFELIRYADGTWAWHLERHFLNREKFYGDSRPDLKYDSAVKAHDAMVLFYNGVK